MEAAVEVLLVAVEGGSAGGLEERLRAGNRELWTP